MMTLPNAEILWVIAGVFIVLLAGSLARIASMRKADPAVVSSRMGSLKSWWAVFGLVAVAVVVGRLGAVLLLGIASFLALREYLHITVQPSQRQGIGAVALGLVPLHYACILWQWDHGVTVLVPVAGTMLVAALAALLGTTSGFIRTVGGTVFGLLVTVYLLSHAARLFTLPSLSTAGVGAAGWFLYLIILTESNDIAQALTGRRLGRRKICPHVSPQKTWEGLCGGILVTVTLAVILSPLLTSLADETWLRQQKLPLPRAFVWAAPLGLLVALLGFLGDITMSAVKRDVGVKDGSTLLPGQGGMIDRVDSLTCTAPAVYYFVRWLTDAPTGTGL